MRKDAYYFPHFSNSKDEYKCSNLIEDLGLEGYGIFWVLLEVLRDQPNYKYPLNLIPTIARKYNTKYEVIEKVINNYDLFSIVGDLFYSKSFYNQMKEINRIRERQSAGGKEGNRIRYKKLKDSVTDQIPITHRSLTDHSPVTNRSQGKESKAKEIKANIFNKPTLDELTVYCRERNNNVSPESFYDYYETRGWTVGKNNNPMKEWRSAIRLWEKSIQVESSNLGVGERLDHKGERTYGANRITVPKDAPPRPSNNHYWNNNTKKWEVRV